ncbi:MAG: alginate export family protein, partial [Pseudomonadota bacterium]
CATSSHMKPAIMLLFVLFSGVAFGADSKPWRLNNALQTPDWLSLSGTFRARFENLDDRFRRGRTGSDQAVVSRLTLKSELKLGDFVAAGELIDSRAFFNDTGSNVSAGIVNSTELLQGYLRWAAEGLFSEQSTSALTLGRMTLDVGSRRFVARNRFRNTINSFTGIDWRWQDKTGREFRAFYLLPVQRLPNDRPSLLDNDAAFDKEHSDVSFWGVFYKFSLWHKDFVELYAFLLDEDDATNRRTKNREITTTGFRVWRKAAMSQFHYTLESAIQFGDSRATTAATDTTDLDHLAHFHHVEVGYSFAARWQPRLLFQYDYASGDNNPIDRDNERFDTLFGARRFEWGPTGIYGPFARANLSSPGLRLKVKPAPNITSFLAYRGYWLASDKDAWTTAGVRDPSGNGGAFLGHQIDFRVRYNPAPKNIRIEMGLAHLFLGEFAETAPNANSADDLTYSYSQVVLTF